MGRKSIQVTGGPVCLSDGQWPFLLRHRCSLLILSWVIFLMPVDPGWGIEGRKVSVSTSERTLNDTKHWFCVQEEWKILAFNRGKVEPHGLWTISPTGSPPRTSRSLVNTVMALLATFEEAGVLPPEGTAQANQIIHALIQLQSVVVKTSDPEFQRFVGEAIRVQVGNEWEEIYRSLPQTGLTSIVFEALVTYASQAAVWEQQGVVRAFRQFNVTKEDWVVVETIFLRARDAYAQEGVSIHTAFAGWLKKMT